MATPAKERCDQNLDEKLEKIKKEIKDAEKDKAECQKELEWYEENKAGYQQQLLRSNATPDEKYRRVLEGQVVWWEKQIQEQASKLSQDEETIRLRQSQLEQDLLLLKTIEEKYKPAIKEQRKIQQLLVQCCFLGPARAGKSSLIDRLLGKPPLARSEVRSSTIAAENPRLVEVNKCIACVSAAESGFVWNLLDNLSEEAYKVVSQLNLLEPHETVSLRKRFRQIKSKLTPTKSNPRTTRPASASLLVDTLKSAVINAESKIKSSEDSWTLYMNDCGGQPEFQELLPILLSGPSIFFLVFPLIWDLRKKYMVEYLDSETRESMVSYESNLTLKEMLMQSLVTIASTSTGEDGVPPKVLFVGTHKDLIEPKEKMAERIDKIDKELKLMVKETAFDKGMIMHASESRMILDIDNLSERVEDVAKIRQVVQKAVTGIDRKTYVIETPYRWMTFAIGIRQQSERLLDYESCCEVARQCGIKTRKEFDKALHFFHHRCGILRHFRDVPDVINLVIIDPRLLFEMVSKLVIETFTFDHTNKTICEEFKKKGIFPEKALRDLSSVTAGILTTEMIVSLLVHLHIIAPLKENGVIKEYFLPCSLVHASEDPTQISADAISLPSLLFTFESGYCPRGLFGAIVAYLIKEKTGCKFEWKFKKNRIYRNRISIAVGPFADTFRFTLHPTYVQVEVLPIELSDRDVPLETVCSHVKEQIVRGLTEVTAKFNYVHKAHHITSLECPCSGPTHPATVTFFDGKPTIMTCTLTGKDISRKDFPNNYSLWFDRKTLSVPETSSPQDGNTEAPTLDECDNLGLHLNMKNLLLIKYTDSQGEEQRLRILETICNKWWDIGTMLEISSPKLHAWNTKHLKDPEKCCRAVMEHWLDNEDGGSADYPVTWDGLCVLLVDIKESQLSIELKLILKEHFGIIID